MSFKPAFGFESWLVLPGQVGEPQGKRGHRPVTNAAVYLRFIPEVVPDSDEALKILLDNLYGTLYDQWCGFELDLGATGKMYAIVRERTKVNPDLVKKEVERIIFDTLFAAKQD